MKSNTFHLPIGEIINPNVHWQQCRLMQGNHLCYSPPITGGWGTRTGLLVPESAMLIVSPAGCMRHSAITAIQYGLRKRLFLLPMDEMDTVTGQHLEKIPIAMAEILATVKPRPKAMLIYSTCIDDLLGSDYDGLARQLEAKHGIPVRSYSMNIVVMDGKMPMTLDGTIYDFLQRTTRKERAVNIIGSFAPIDDESEFYEVMATAEFNKIRHIAACTTLEEFREMSSATHNILIKPRARFAAQQMVEKLGIPYCFAPTSYGLKTIDQTYRALGEFLGVKLCTEQYREEAVETIKSYRKLLGPLSVAIGSMANASPFELARAFTEYDFHVQYIFAYATIDSDREHVDWLKHHNPDIKVFSNNHPTMVNSINQKLTVDLAVGLDAGYFCSGAKTVPLTYNKQPFGYRGVIYLFREMLRTLENPQNHREQMFTQVW